MVHFFPVAQFVYYHVIQYLGWAEHEQTIEIQVALGRTASPFAFLVSDGDTAITDADQSGIVAHPVRNHLQGFISQSTDFFFCERGGGLRNTVDVLCYPCLMPFNKIINL